MGDDRSGRHWTLSEDLALASQASHGPEWDGWKELLPGRTRWRSGCAFRTSRR